MESKVLKQGFTLAEIMIVLMVIGIITAILLPIARHATPDENVLKFKKANATLGNVIRELVTSDKYYLDGDLGTRADGTLIDGSHDGDGTYFCQSFADLISTKSINCSETTVGNEAMCIIAITNANPNPEENWIISIEDGRAALDYFCNLNTEIEAEIQTQDNVVFWQNCPNIYFGIIEQNYRDMTNANRESLGIETLCTGEVANTGRCLERMFSDPNSSYVHFPDKNGFDMMYKIFCIDIDGINRGEDPFGYGIRADGKILYGARAQEWIEKSIQGKD